LALEIANPHQINGKIRSYKILKIDRELAQKHLCYLGYKPGEPYLRFFYHSSDDRKNKDKGRKESQCNWTPIEEYQKDGRGSTSLSMVHRADTQMPKSNSAMQFFVNGMISR
jgi:hypothetical protein